MALAANRDAVLGRLEELGTDQTRRIWTNHGAREPFFGVKIGDMKLVLKELGKAGKKNQELASALYATGNADAMYFAGMIADPQAVTPEELDRWAEESTWYMTSEYAVAGVAAESPYGWQKGLAWIDSDKPWVAAAGWATLGLVVAHRPDADLDLETLGKLLQRVETEIDDGSNRERYQMNGFVIAVGCYVEDLTAEARRVGEALGTVKVDVGNTACKVPLAAAYIDKVVSAGRLGKKRKTVRC